MEYHASIVSPIGPLRIRAMEKGICAVDFADHPVKNSVDAPKFLTDAIGQLEEYFAGSRRAFTDLPLLVAATDFQEAVWDALANIPYGTVRTYGQLAALVDRPGGAQAIGQALTRNPIPIIVPCHRIIPSTGETGGYAGGAERKAWLLQMEKGIADM